MTLKEQEIYLEANIGTDIDDAITQAVAYANAHGSAKNVILAFNGCDLVIKKDHSVSLFSDIYRQWFKWLEPGKEPPKIKCPGCDDCLEEKDTYWNWCPGCKPAIEAMKQNVVSEGEKP